MLGWVTGLLGAGAIAATTVAVESVVLRHLHQQMDALRDIDPLGAAAVAAILDDERKHHDESVEQQKSAAVWNIVLKPVVSASNETVIWLGMRL